LKSAGAWASSWATRLTATRFADLAKELGVLDGAELDQIAADLTRWAEHPDAYFAMPAGEALIHVP
jgi:hypothetical protein